MSCPARRAAAAGVVWLVVPAAVVLLLPWATVARPTTGDVRAGKLVAFVRLSIVGVALVVSWRLIARSVGLLLTL